MGGTLKIVSVFFSIFVDKEKHLKKIRTQIVGTINFL